MKIWPFDQTAFGALAVLASSFEECTASTLNVRPFRGTVNARHSTVKEAP